jgi:hypothetical protein
MPLGKPSKTLFKLEVACAGDVSKGVLRIKRASGGEENKCDLWERYYLPAPSPSDYAHLAVTFCRCLNIPARYCTGFLTDVGLPPPYPPNDFAAWIEVYLGGRWRTFDPRNKVPRIGRALIAQGRDAADEPLTHTFGQEPPRIYRFNDVY